MSTVAIDPARSRDKQEWLAAFDGAYLRKTVGFKNLHIRTLFRRHFDVLGRASYFISARARAILKSDDDVTKVEEHLSANIRNQTLTISNLLGQLNKVKEAANVSSEASHNEHAPQDVVVVTGYQTKFIKMLGIADETMSLMELLWLEGEIEPSRRAECMWVIKRAIRAVTTAARMLQLSLLKRRNEMNRAANDEGAGDAKEANTVVQADKPAQVGKAAANSEPAIAAA